MRRWAVLLVQVPALFVYFLWELVLSNMRVARDVLLPVSRLRPAVVAVPLDLKSDWPITLLSALITLTPGTFSLDVSSDRRVLYIHAMHVTDVEALPSEIKSGFEKRIGRLLP
ncbi:MAG TPA: Na+/H+ antiporter subunit E [Bryobacteraceae bacterium]|nr:Na+/H+ antiporter subunit E [Bryobacteraceae bacterium]